MAYPTPDEAQPTGSVVALGSRVEILTTSPAGDIAFAGGPTCMARFRGDTSPGLVAVVCKNGLAARHDMINTVRSINHPSILKMVENGVVVWPADGTRHFAFAYTRPTAPLMAQSLSDTFAPMGEDAIIHHFAIPMMSGLRELARVGAVHNGIRPTNIYWRVGSATAPQLGEFLSAPAGYNQPVLFETIERGMCNPLGRGPGSHIDDCYAFGVTLALLILGHNPMKDMEDRAIVQAKIERGTFGALIGNSRLSAAHIELLRGLLTDDARQRWTAADLEQWQTGRRLTPKSSDSGRRASRHIDFNGKEYWQVKPLANALSHNTSEAMRQIEDGSIDKWLRRAMGDETSADHLADARASLKEIGRTGNYEEQLVCRACIALDPSAPIKYRGLAVLPAGIAAMMVDAANTSQNIQILSEIVSSQLVTLWVSMQKEVRPEIVPIGQQFERLRSQIDKVSLGSGFERVLYELNPGLPCLSPIIKTQYVNQPKALLTALEDVAKSGNRGREPMDRHIAAFLVVRDRRSESMFDAAAAPEGSSRRGIALLTLFADMQNRYGPDALPHLAQWLMPLLEASTRRFLGKAARDRTALQLRDSAERGNLSVMLRLLDDQGRVTHDQQEFMAARMLYLNTMKEIAHIEKQLGHRDDVAQTVGKPIAATFSSFLAIIFVLIAILRVVWQNMAM